MATIADSLNQFSMDLSTGKADAGRMENCLACLLSHKVPIPLAFDVIFYREKSSHLIKFKMWSEFAVHVSMRDGHLAAADAEFDKEAVVQEVIDSALNHIACNVDLDNRLLNVVLDVVKPLSEPEHLLPESVREDLASLVSAIDPAAASTEGRTEAIAKLDALTNDATYVGALKSFTNSEAWAHLKGSGGSVQTQDPHPGITGR